MSHIKTSIKVFSNIELITKICEFLNFEEQYKLQYASRDVANIIINYVWKIKFKELLIYTNENDTIISDKIDLKDTKSNLNEFQSTAINNLYFQHPELEEFLNLNKNNIKKLYINGNSETCLTYGLKLKFNNLTYLCLCQLILTDVDVKQIAVNCRNLADLILKENVNLKNERLLVDGDIEIGTIKSMLNLKMLTIIDNRYLSPKQKAAVYKFSNIRNILMELKLQCLILDVFILPDISPVENPASDLSPLKNIKVFEIATFKAERDFRNFQFNFLPNFQNLHTLTLRGAKIHREFFNILKDHNRNLINLTLRKCIIKEFTSLPQLKHLTLDTCLGLKALDLKTILNEMLLTSFTTMYCDYAGDLTNFTLSPTLRKLEFENFPQNKFIKIFETQFKPLNKLNDLKLLLEDQKTESLNLRLSKLVPNLEMLQTNLLFSNLEDFSNLKFLQKVFIVSLKSITVCQVLLLLKQNFKELIIDHVLECKMDMDLTKLQVFESKLLLIDLNWSIMEIMGDFFLDLLQLNKNMSLVIRDIEFNMFRSNIWDNAKFPQRCKSIKICGVSLDLNFIRDHPEEAFGQIENIMTTFKIMYLRSYFMI
ncbi:uncharacterized protein ACRADG_003081 [Cochliomyia hominivorax]